MAVPKIYELTLPALKLAARGTFHLSQAVEILSDEFQLTREARARKHPKSQAGIMGKNTDWAIALLVMTKLAERPKRGFFTITKRGKEVLANPPKQINHQFLKKFPEYKKIPHS